MCVTHVVRYTLPLLQRQPTPGEDSNRHTVGNTDYFKSKIPFGKKTNDFDMPNTTTPLLEPPAFPASPGEQKAALKSQQGTSSAGRAMETMGPKPTRATTRGHCTAERAVKADDVSGKTELSSLVLVYVNWFFNFQEMKGNSSPSAVFTLCHKSCTLERTLVKL